MNFINSIINSILNCFRNCCRISGRTSKAEYTTFMYFLAVIYIIPNMRYDILAYIFVLPVYTATIRRLHDTNRSAIFCFFMPFPVIAYAIAPYVSADTADTLFLLSILAGLLSLPGFIYSCCSYGTYGDNRYGPDPEGRAPLTPDEERVVRKEAIKDFFLSKYRKY